MRLLTVSIIGSSKQLSEEQTCAVLSSLTEKKKKGKLCKCYLSLNCNLKPHMQIIRSQKGTRYISALEGEVDISHMTYFTPDTFYT